MDQKEYFFYTLRSPDEYWTEYGRPIDSVSQEELRDATVKYDQQLQDYIQMRDFERNAETHQRDALQHRLEQLALERQMMQTHPVFQVTNRGDHVEITPVGDQTIDTGRVAQLDEQRSSKPKVEGSTPSTPTNDLKNRFDDLLYGCDDE